MSKFNRGKLRDELRFVNINGIIYYGFKAKDASAIPGISTTDLTALGQTAAANIADSNTKILVFSPQSPKPRSYKKNLNNPAGQQQSFTSFCSHTAYGTALAAGFTPVAPEKKVRLRANPSRRGTKITAIAELSNGLLYCWPMDATDFADVAAELGLKNAAQITTQAEKNRLCVAPGAGCRPGRASKELASGTISSFFSFGANIAAGGWNLDEEEGLGIDTFSAAAPTT